MHKNLIKNTLKNGFRLDKLIYYEYMVISQLKLIIFLICLKIYHL